jgi:hypothetical protein
MTEHSPEPWSAVLNKHPEGPAAEPDNWLIGDVNNRTVAISPLYYRDTEADAKRIVACVNACQGISTKLLNKITEEHGGILKDTMEYGWCGTPSLLVKEGAIDD